MMTFDYYVSGLKLGHQVPRFEVSALDQGQETRVTLNDWLQTYPLVVLIFTDDLRQAPLLAPGAIDHVQLAYVSKLPLKTLQALNINDGLICSDERHALLESYGAIDERTGKIIPSVVAIENTGNLRAVYRSHTLNAPSKEQLLRLLEGLIPN